MEIDKQQISLDIKERERERERERESAQNALAVLFLKYNLDKVSAGREKYESGVRSGCWEDARGQEEGGERDRD